MKGIPNHKLLVGGSLGLFPRVCWKILRVMGSSQMGFERYINYITSLFFWLAFSQVMVRFFLGCERTSQDHSFEEDDLFLLQLEDRL